MKRPEGARPRYSVDHSAELADEGAVEGLFWERGREWRVQG